MSDDYYLRMYGASDDRVHLATPDGDVFFSCFSDGDDGRFVDILLYHGRTQRGVSVKFSRSGPDYTWSADISQFHNQGDYPAEIPWDVSIDTFDRLGMSEADYHQSRKTVFVTVDCSKDTNIYVRRQDDDLGDVIERESGRLGEMFKDRREENSDTDQDESGMIAMVVAEEDDDE